MKRYILSLILVAFSAMASFGRGILTFSQAQEQAYFLTDKMAYELDLTPYQFDQVYQINLEYFLNVTPSDITGFYWQCRNSDLGYVLYEWQYNRFVRASDFYRPIQWRAADFFIALWNRYRPSYYFYTRPTSWASYRGGIWNNRKDYRISPFEGRRPAQHIGGMRRNPQYAPPAPPAPGMKPGNGPRPQGNGYNRPQGNGNTRPQGNGYNRPQGNGNNRPQNNGGGNVNNGGGNRTQSNGGMRGQGGNTSKPTQTDRPSNPTRANRGGGR